MTAWSTVTTPVTATAISSTTFGIPVATNMATLGAAWTTYAPTVTGITKGNGTEIARWMQVGKTIDVFYQFTFGSTSAMTTGQTVTLPATALNSGWAGFGQLTDASATAFWPILPVSTSTSLVAFRTTPGTAGNAWVGMTSAVPFTWATSDVFQFQLRYEAA